MGKFQNFDQNAEERRIMQLQHERRMALRAQFWKNMTDPNRHGTGEGGFLFDPAMMRFQAMRVSHFEHFRPTGKSAFMGLALCVFPIALIHYAQRKERDAREKKISNGEVSYRDRQFKFI